MPRNTQTADRHGDADNARFGDRDQAKQHMQQN
jgi:hypothetical protein